MVTRSNFCSRPLNRTVHGRELFYYTKTKVGKRRWLKKSGIQYEEITFCDEDKLPALKKYNISYMVEDDPDNIMAMHDITKVICMNAKCNQHLIEECACRCDSFEEDPNEGIRQSRCLRDSARL